jgi:hypothetical protein
MWNQEVYQNPKKSKGLTPDEIAADEEFVKLLASLKYIRVNFTPMSAHAALYETLSHPITDWHWVVIF